MGNQQKIYNYDKDTDSEWINEDIKTKGSINCYICGDINTFLESDQNMEFNLNASRNYFILQEIFPDVNEKRYGFIKSKSNEVTFPYEFRQKINKDKIYNAFLFLNKIDETFLQVLLTHLYDYDIGNNNKNILIYFGEDNLINDALNILCEESQETLPFLIIVNNTPLNDEKLRYTNYIPNLNSITRAITNERRNLTEKELDDLSVKALINYLNTKLLRMDMYYNQLGYDFNKINPMNEIYSKIKMNVTIGLLGYSWCDKNIFVNLIFNELVSRTNASKRDIRTKCIEYYLPIRTENRRDIGQIRFLDFPGISEDINYQKVIEPEIMKKMDEYKKNMEQIDVALFFISNGEENELTENGLKLIQFLHKNKVKIIFVMNGKAFPAKINIKKEELRNIIDDIEILNNNFDNFINTDFDQYYRDVKKTGISKIFRKIVDIIRIKDENFRVEDIKMNNYNEKLLELSQHNTVFEKYKNMNSIKEKCKFSSTLAVTGYSALACGSSALSIIVPLVDSILAISYQVAMVYSVLNIYELNPNDYDIIKIILSGGNIIEEKNKNNINNNEEVKKGNLKQALKNTTNTAIFAGQKGLQAVGVKEAEKKIIEKTVQTVAAETLDIAALKVSEDAVEALIYNSAKVSVSNAVEKIAVESSKELAKTGMKEGTKIAIDVSKAAFIATAANGADEYLIAGTSESIKAITEKIVIKQGGKSWLINLGKAVPFIGAGISAIMNTYQTAKLGAKLVEKFNGEFYYNKQRQVNLLRGRVKSLLNIIEQMNLIIQDEANLPHL